MSIVNIGSIPKSSDIKSAVYDNSTGILTVVYKDTSIYSTGDLRNTDGASGVTSAVWAVGNGVFSSTTIVADKSFYLDYITSNVHFYNSGSYYLVCNVKAVPLERTITVNGTTKDLTANVEFTIPTGTGTVTSVGISAGTGISVSGTNPITSSGTISVTNTAPDQTVALTAGTGIGVSGTYPNFTITNSSPSSGGTVTSVAALTLGTSGSDLSSSVATGTTTPVITLNVPSASASNRGALTSTDWSTFNSKGSGSVTSVGMSLPTGLSISGSPITTSGTLAVSLTSGYFIPTTTEQTNWNTAYSNRITSANTPLSISSNTVSISQANGSTSGYLSSTDWTTFNNKQSGTVTSVALSVPTGLSISGSPITTSGTLALTLTSGYVIPTTTEETNWNTAYTNRITSLTTTGSNGAATLVSNTLNIPTYINSWRTMTPSSSASGRYYTTPCGSQAQASVVNINTGVGMWGIPFPVGDTAVTATKIGMATDGGGSAGTKILLSIYNDDGTTTKAGTLLTQCGTINCDTLGLQTITISQTLSANTMYWLVGHVQSGNNVKPSAAAKNTSLVNLGYPITSAAATDYYTWISSVQTYTGTAITPFPTSPTYNSGIMPLIFLQL